MGDKEYIIPVTFYGSEEEAKKLQEELSTALDSLGEVPGVAIFPPEEFKVSLVDKIKNFFGR